MNLLDGPNSARSVLVLGYGNTLRADDGAGPCVAERVATLGLPHLRALALQQLAPEHAALAASSRGVIFVDASLAPSDGVSLQPLDPQGATPALGHTSDPCFVLALARDLFGNTPPAWRLTIPVVAVGFGEILSPATERNCEEAVRRIVALYHALDSAPAIGDSDPRKSLQKSASPFASIKKSSQAGIPSPVLADTSKIRA